MNRRILLFDVDGTLIRTAGAGRRAMDLAFSELFAIHDGLRDVEMAGRIDAVILRSAFFKHGLPTVAFDADLRRFRDAYCRHLSVTLREAQGHVLPGVHELLIALKQVAGVRLGLATGNFRSGAVMKLSHYGLWSFFEGGAFGDDCEERAELVARAIESMRDGIRSASDRVYVIGDTVYDIQAARANRAVAVAVATGGTTEDDLLAAKPDLYFSDLSNWQSLMEALGVLQRRVRSVGAHPGIP